MRISLIAVDGHSGFSNLALMRLFTWHKQQGDAVEWWNGFMHYDRVYKSKVTVQELLLGRISKVNEVQCERFSNKVSD